MPLSDYTDNDTIRATLGVSAMEIKDTTLDLPIYETLLVEDINAVSTDIIPTYEALVAIMSPTSIQTRFINLTKAFSAYAVAARLLNSLAMFSAVTIKGVKQEFTRVDDPYADLKVNIPYSLSFIKSKLNDSLAAVNFPNDPAPPPVVRTFMVGAGLAYDPVTGRRQF